jgi:hypothetical protein
MLVDQAVKRIEEIQVTIDKSDSEFVFASLLPISGVYITQGVPCPPHQMRLNVDVIKTYSQREALLFEYGGRCDPLS